MMNSDEIAEVVDFYKRATLEELCERADQVCRQNYGDRVFLRGLIEFSSYCSRNCLYCGIRSDNHQNTRYRLDRDEILASVSAGYKAGLRTFVLQSGEDPFFTCSRLTEIISDIKEITRGEAAVTLSCGIMSREELQKIRESGCDRYLMRFEISDAHIHSRLRQGISLEQRLETLRNIKSLGFETGSGYMVGLPGETEKIRLDNALLCHELQLDMVGVGPFIPHENTPLKDSGHHLALDMAVKAVALLRLLLPHANIPATTAAGSVDPQGREKMLAAGANVLMPNITPVRYKKDYQLYPGKICLDESGLDCLECLKKRVGKINKKLDMSRGDSLAIQDNKTMTP